MTTKERFIQATKDWYSYVNKDHHKDRDCHWTIGVEKIYSYGRDSENAQGVWFARHEGYIMDLWVHGETEDEVMEKAAQEIEDYIRENPHDPT